MWGIDIDRGRGRDIGIGRVNGEGERLGGYGCLFVGSRVSFVKVGYRCLLSNEWRDFRSLRSRG